MSPILPNEIYLCIISYIDPGSLMNFALANKTLHSLCTSFLAEHKILHRKWRIVDPSDPQRRHTSPWELAISCLHDPHVAWHIREYESSTKPDGSFPEDPFLVDESIIDADSLVARYIAMTKNRYRLLSSFEWRTEEDGSKKVEDRAVPWAKHIQWGIKHSSSRPLEAMILTILHNIHTLRLPYEECVVYITNRFPGMDPFPAFERFLGPLAPTSPLPPETAPMLSSLRYLELGMEGVDEEFHAHHIISFTRLPSLQKLKGHNILSYDDEFENNFELPVRKEYTCPLIDIDIRGGITPGCWAEILRGIRNDQGYGLQRFVFEQFIYNEYPVDCFHGTLLIELLHKFAGHSLKILNLGIHNSCYMQYDLECEHTKLDDEAQVDPDEFCIHLGCQLRKIENLKALQISSDMLVDEIWLLAELNEDSVHTGIFSDAEQPLARLLPPSLEALSVKASYFSRADDAILRKLVILLRDDFISVPRLKVLELFEEAPNSRYFEKLSFLCSEHGVHLECHQAHYEDYCKQIEIAAPVEF